MKMVKLVMFAGYRGVSFSYKKINEFSFSFSKYSFLKQSNHWNFDSPFSKYDDVWVRSFCWRERIILSRIRRKFK